MGLDNSAKLEVTNCFPFPSRVDSFERNSSADPGTNYQIDMMRSLRDVNVDSNTVGWYQVFFFHLFILVMYSKILFTYTLSK